MSGCVMCGKQRTGAVLFWILRNYCGLSGTFCDACYLKIRHDAYGRPMNPIMYRLAVVKLNKERDRCTQ